MNENVTELLRSRERARGIRDRGLEAAITADLERLGYRETETTVAVLPERAIPEAKRKGRRPMPRCEHGRVVGRCDECDDEGDDAA